MARGRIEVKEGLQGMREVSSSNASESEQKHVSEIIAADNAGDLKELKRLIKAGEKAERWI